MFVDHIAKNNRFLKKTWINIDLTGFRYGMITYRNRLNKHKFIWCARCICGADMIVQAPYRHYRDDTMRSSCGCSGGLEQDHQDLPTAMFIKLPHLYPEKMNELYDIWVEQIVTPSSTTSIDDWYTKDGINHCEPSWLSFYSFSIDVGIPPDHSKELKKINHTEPFGVNNFFWSLTPVGNWKPSVTRLTFRKESAQESSSELLSELDTLVSSFVG